MFYNRSSKQFRHCQATISKFETEKGNFTIFYSYTCPKIVIFPDGYTARFTFEGSRKEGSINSSKTTSKQCNKRLGYNHYELPTLNLETFEKKFFDTRLEFYY